MIKQILELFFAQPIFQDLPPVVMMAYFQNLMDNGQLITIEQEGKIKAFCDFWIINEKIREGLSKLDLLGMAMIFNSGSYPHVEGGHHLYVSFMVVNKEDGIKAVNQLMRQIEEKNPQALTVCYHRFAKDGKFRIIQVRGRDEGKDKTTNNQPPKL